MIARIRNRLMCPHNQKPGLFAGPYLRFGSLASLYSADVTLNIRHRFVTRHSRTTERSGKALGRFFRT